MRIGGYLPFSLSDYPGLTAAVVFTQGCNFRCPYCHNAALLGPVGDGAYDADDILRRLERRRGLLQGVVVSGGEPTLQTGLLDFCAAVRKMGFRVKLDTNGSRPAVLHALLKAGVIDYVAMDIKAPAHKYDRLAGVSVDVEAIEESIATLSQFPVTHHFRTTWVAGMLDEADKPDLLAMVPEGASHVMQTCRPQKTLALAG